VLDVVFALNRAGDCLMKLHVHEALQPVSLRESLHEPLAMFIGASANVGRDSGIKSAVRAVRHDVDPAAGHWSITAWVAGTRPAMTVHA
jgi:hypothetical protein